MQLDILFKSKKRLIPVKPDLEEKEEPDDMLDQEYTHRVTFEIQKKEFLSFFELIKICYYNTLWR